MRGAAARAHLLVAFCAALAGEGCFFSLDEKLWWAEADARGEVAAGDGSAAAEDLGAAEALPGSDGCADECTEGTQRCADAAATQACARGASGCTTWGAAQPCPAGAGCVDGQCAAACTASGIATACDPIAQTGCAAGSCYLTGSGPACVCPAGDIAEGADCNTTVRCAPGLVCAGTSAPGTCSRVCDPDQPACDSAQECIFITMFPDYGYCRPAL